MTEPADTRSATVTAGSASTGSERARAYCRDVYSGHGKLEMLPKITVSSLSDLAVAYTPGVGSVVSDIVAAPDSVHELTGLDNTIALVTNGTAVLGFGDVGPRAAIPVMEGKACMFKLLAGIDCIPLCVDARTPAEMIVLMRALSPGFSGFNLEDVAAPACFEVMAAAERDLGIPTLHDDQFGTATVILAGVLNACRVLGRDPGTLRVVVNGIGAAGTAAVQLLNALSVGDVIAVDRDGILNRRCSYAHAHWNEIAAATNADGLSGDLRTALRGADCFIGVSAPDLVDAEMIRSMASAPIVFALSNPRPEILPDAARAAGAIIAASGRFDYPNHCNNVLAFPALMRGAIDTAARRISIGMCLAAARSIADQVGSDLGPEHLLPSPLSQTLYPEVAEAVARQAIDEGLARRTPMPGWVRDNTARLRALVAARQTALPARPHDGGTGQ